MANKNTAYEQSGEIRNRGKGQFIIVINRLLHNPSAIIGMTIVLVLALLAVFAPYVAPYDYQEMNVAVAKQGPSAEHWFGTDDLGRDIFSRLIYAGRYSLTMGIASVALSFVISVVLGSVAGFFGGWIDNLIMRLLDCISAIPGLLMAILVSAALGTGYMNTVLALAVGGVGGMTRLLRAQVMSERGKEYAEAARATNCTSARIIFHHILPNAMTPMIVNATGLVAGSLLFAASLSFIGLGVQPPTPEWGAMLAGARSYVRTYPHMLIFPGLFICVTVIGLNMLGDALRDAMDPKLKK